MIVNGVILMKILSLNNILRCGEDTTAYETDELEFKKNKAIIEKQVENYHSGHANILSEDEYNEKMSTFMKDLKTKSFCPLYKIP